MGLLYNGIVDQVMEMPPNALLLRPVLASQVMNVMKGYHVTPYVSVDRVTPMTTMKERRKVLGWNGTVAQCTQMQPGVSGALLVQVETVMNVQTAYLVILY